MKRCKHEISVSFQETIEAYHQRHFDEREYFCNNEYGHAISVSVICNDCHIQRSITLKNQSKMPRWIADRIEIMKAKNEWFFY